MCIQWENVEWDWGRVWKVQNLSLGYFCLIGNDCHAHVTQITECQMKRCHKYFCVHLKFICKCITPVLSLISPVVKMVFSTLMRTRSTRHGHSPCANPAHPRILYKWGKWTIQTVCMNLTFNVTEGQIRWRILKVSIGFLSVFNSNSVYLWWFTS